MSATSESVISHSFDLIVIGGGLPGLCAAIAAARSGITVALVQDRPVLGGNCSSEVRVVPHGANHNNAWAGETGIPHALILDDRANNHESFFDHGMINAIFDLNLLQAAQRESNLMLFLNTTVRSVESEPVDPAAPVRAARSTANNLGRLGGERRRITAVRASQMGSEAEFRLIGRQFVDATGDGTIGFLAGADFRYGREARHEFDEPLAPAVSDDVTMGATITMRARDIGRPVTFTPPPGIKIYRSMQEIGFKRTIYHLNKPVYGGYWWLEVCNPFHQIRDNVGVRDELHRHVLGVWNYIKNYSDQRERATNYALDWIGMIPGKRESRRLAGAVTLSERDCHDDRRWPDAIGFAGWWIDLHIKGGILNKVDPGERENADRNYKHWIRIPVFTLPLRSFYSANVENLWMAGRCLSTTHVALGPVRVMQTLAQLGQAVGTAAAWALRRDLLPAQVADPDGPQITPLQQRLLRDDVRIPGLVNKDPGDLALQATARASSEAALVLDRVDPKAWFNLGISPTPGRMHSPALAMVVPVTEPRIEQLSFYLRNEKSQAQTLTVTVSPLERIWDRGDIAPVAKGTLIVPPGSASWCEVTLNADVKPGLPHRIALSGGDGIAWAGCADWPVGTTMQYLHSSPGGPEDKNRHLPGFAPTEVSIPAYRHWRQLRTALAMKLSPPSYPFGAANINNGRAWPESLPNLWISDPAQPLPQNVDLIFSDAREVSTIEVSFDTNLSKPIQSEEPYYRSPECVRDWRVLALAEEGWREVYSERNNHQRKRTAHFSPVTTTALRLECCSTHGDPSARVYEVRLYNEVQSVA